MTLYDNPILKALSPSQELKFLSYTGETSYFRTKLKNTPNEMMFQTMLQLENTKKVHIRYTNSFWEIAGLAGGFSVFAIFMFQFLYKLAKSNSVYILNQAYMKS